MQKTDISWTTFSANPLKYRRKSDGKVVWACVKTSPGCRSCYSEAIALRFERGKLFNAANMEELEPFLDEKELHEMLTRKQCGGVAVSGSRVFVGDMTDLFGEWVSDGLLNRLFAVFALRPDVTWQVLTKRAERMAAYMNTPGRDHAVKWATATFPVELSEARRVQLRDCDKNGRNADWWPLLNAHLGTSVENQATANERIPHLLRTPAAVRFLSAEPLLGPVDLSCVCFSPTWMRLYPGERIHWCITGCESGPKRRPMDPAWDASLEQQCRIARTAFFRKQIEVNGKVSGDMAEWPADLRVRQMPEVTTP